MGRSAVDVGLIVALSAASVGVVIFPPAQVTPCVDMGKLLLFLLMLLPLLREDFSLARGRARVGDFGMGRTLFACITCLIEVRVVAWWGIRAEVCPETKKGEKLQ